MIRKRIVTPIDQLIGAHTRRGHLASIQEASMHCSRQVSMTTDCI
jgi:hypothetical protein